MAKEIRRIVEGMPSEILEPKDDYRDDALRVKACVHYLIGYLEVEEEAYKGEAIAKSLGVICKGKEWLEAHE